MSQPTLKLRLILDVEYVRQGTSPEELIQNLQTIVTHSVDNGMMTGDSSAYVQTWDAGVTEVEDFDSPATYMTCIELGDLITAAEEGRLNAEGDMNAMVEDAEEAYDAHDAAITAGYRHLKAMEGDVPLTELDTTTFVAYLTAHGGGIDPEEAYRDLCTNWDAEFPTGAGSRPLEQRDYPAFRQGLNDHADGMQKSREWVTFDNGNCYFTAEAVKGAIAHFDESEYAYEPKLKEAVSWWL